MKKIRNGIRLIRLFFRLVFEMIRNYPFLNQDIEHNFLICKKICKKIVKSAKIGLQVHNPENIPKDERFLLVSNHRCFFDVVFLLASLEEAVSFVAAKELWHYPVLRKYLDSIGCVALDRYSREMWKIKESIRSMKTALSGGNLVLFPEGECSYHDTHIKKFKKGGFLGLSKEQNIVPVFLKIDSLRNIGRWMIPEGDVSIFVGHNFTPAEINQEHCSVKEIVSYTREQILSLQEMSSS